jgi:hypothetical protein
MWIELLIFRFERLVAYLWTLIPDAHCEGCDPPFVPAWVWPTLEWAMNVLERLYVLCGCG